jgi:phosphate transport system substrate-binding protein
VENYVTGEGHSMSVRHSNINHTKMAIISVVMSAVLALATSVQAGDIVVRVGGAGSGLGAMKFLADVYEKSHPGTKIKILPSLGSSGGITALLHGALDIAISGRGLKPEEQKEGAVAIEYARTPFVFIVNKSVNKADVTTREVEMIFGGQLLKWPDGSRIRLILRPENEADTLLLKTISNNMEQAVTFAQTRPDMIIAVSNQESDDAVAKIPGAFGGSTLTQIETEKRPVKILSFNGIIPSLDSVSGGGYPLVKPLLLVTAPNTPATALSFVKFVRSSQGRAILVKYGALPSAADKRIK